ncbi:T9SS type A sorting domain-containing protein [Psychroserpens jangbogonensis]|uniref:T9SS type A sorting domain-containing protein n=1 Tax=Psychroserpens jangbogonensis TaxID=1484460 RepID=UPI00053E0F88|nr:T9SS type A sorting domain-containing protein [Psychroserpens jangbogonensis]
MKNLYVLLISILLSYSAQAQLGTDVFSVGDDDTGNYGSWNNGDNQGTGFAPWVLTSNGSAGHYRGTSGQGDPSFAMWSDGSGNYASATRNFNSELKKGDKFSVDLGHSSTINGEVFIQLLDDGAPVITLKFVGGSSEWELNDGGSDFGSGQNYDDFASITFTYTYNEDGSYGYTFGTGGNSSISTSPNDLSHINGFKFQSTNQGTGANFGIDNLAIQSKYTITENSTISSSGDMTVPYLDIQSGSTLNIPSNSNVTVSGNLNNSGTLNLTSTSTDYPSVIPNTSSGSGTATYSRFVNSNSNGNDLVSSPLSGQTWASFLDPINSTALLDDGNIAPTEYAFGPFDKTTGDFENYTDATSATLTSATGYRAATDDILGLNLTFTGTISAGTETATISNSGPSFAEWNLIGNPYPSYINVEDFLNNTANGTLLDETNVGVYGYDGDASDGWIIYNLANSTSSLVIAPGQGFFVAAESSGNIEFTSNMRRTGISGDFIPFRNAELVYLMLQLSSGSKNYKTDFYFNTNASLGLDAGYDAGVWGGIAPSFAVYSHLVEDNTGSELAIQSLNSLDVSEVTIPLGVNANQGEQLTFSIADSTLPASVSVYLEDTVANTTTLLNNSDYVITPTTDLSGTGRFFLRTSEDALSTIENSLDTLNIFALHTSKELVVSGQLQENTVLNLYDIQGRKVVSTKLDSTLIQNRIDVSNLNTGVYMVTVQNNSQELTKKVIIK